ncbi:hypothetical protein, partial [Thiocapsa sp.]|uniref:hypothetical protein n=1 Tax=Thiocapsa sp. TaxID=2024551 RepID=UPI002C1B3637
MALLVGAGLSLHAAPVIDNNAGTWTDDYNDSLGVASVAQTEVNTAAGIVQLESGQASGSYRTVTIRPNSFSAWGALTLQANYSAVGDLQVEVLDPADTVLLGGPVNYAGPIDLSSLSAATYPELRVRVTLTAGATRPTVSQLNVTWTPKSFILLNKKAPEEVQAGQQINYRINYSVAFVGATDLVVWDTLPAMTYPADFGQNDNVTFVSATKGGQFTPTAMTVKGVDIPANSVYWDLGAVPEGTTDTVLFTVRTRNGTLDGSVQPNTASADAANADPAVSAPVETIIRSQPSPQIQKRAADGIFALASGNYTQPGGVNRFRIEARNLPAGEGRETMYQTVLFDNLDDLTGKINPNFGGAGIPVADLSPTGGQYTATGVTVNGTVVPPNSVYWDIGALGPGATLTGFFSVEMLNEADLGSAGHLPGQYVNTATLDSFRTTPISANLTVQWPLDESPAGIFAKGDGVGGTFRITGGRDDNPLLYVKPGEAIPFALRVSNSGLVALNDAVFLDRVPDNTTFKSAWFTDPWLQDPDNARIFYSTSDPGNWDTPPAYNLPVDRNNFGADWSTTLPADPADVKWVAVWIRAVNPALLDSSAPGWVLGAPTSGTAFFDVVVDADILDATPCVDQFVTNRGQFRVHALTRFDGTGTDAINPPLAAHDDEPVRVSIDKAILAHSVTSTVTPSLLDEPGPMQFAATIRNNGNAIAQNVLLELRWPRIPINAVPQYLTFAGINRPIQSFDPANGTVVVNLGNLAPGATASATLTVNVPAGLEFGQQLTFTARASADPVPCSVADAVDTATAAARFLPGLRVFKNDVVDLIPSGGFIDYTLTARNIGTGPAKGVWVVDRIPDETVFVGATGPQGEQVWFSDEDNLPPAFLTAMQPLDAAAIAAHFTPGSQSGINWTSPFGNQTRWIAWLMDDATISPPQYPVGTVNTVGFRVGNDLDGPGPNTDGSPVGTQNFNTVGIFSDELIQAIGNEVVTTINDLPGILVRKTGPSFVTRSQEFEWVVTYFNNSGGNNTTTVVTDTLPVGITFVSATHEWNEEALNNGVPANNNSQLVPSSVVANPDGTTTLTFQIANNPGTNGYRGADESLHTTEGGTIVLRVRVNDNIPSGTILQNRVAGEAANAFGTTRSRDRHEVEVRNADTRVTKVAQPPTPVPGDTVNYTLIVANDGLVPAENMVIVDTLPAGLTYVANSTQILSPNYTLGEPAVSGQTLTWSPATANAITRTGLPAGTLPPQSGDILIQYQAAVDGTVNPNTVLPNLVVIGTDTPEDDDTNNQDDADVRTPDPDPAILKTGPAFVNPGDRFNWSIQYFNNTRQPAANVYIVDTLPDDTNDGEADVTFVSQTAPAGVTAYFSGAPSNAAPAFDPTDPTGSGAWSATPPAIVNHISWLVGALPGEAGPLSITVTVDAIRPNNGSPQLPAAGVNMTNVVAIATTDPDEDSSNNQDDHTTRTPGNDIALIKTATSEGNFPGLVPGDPITYTLEVINTGTEIAYGIEVVDTLPAGLTLASPSPGPALLSLVNANGEPVQPVDGL